MENLKKLCGFAAAFFVAAFCIFFLMNSGCGSRNISSQVMKYNDSKIRQLHNCYQLYIQRHQMKGPTNEQEFKAFLKSPGAAPSLELIGKDASMVDDMFISERDGEPFVIRYGVNGHGPAIIFEKTGVDGGRFVAFAPPREITDDAEYDRLLNGEIEEDAISDMSLGGIPEELKQQP